MKQVYGKDVPEHVWRFPPELHWVRRETTEYEGAKSCIKRSICAVWVFREVVFKGNWNVGVLDNWQGKCGIGMLAA